MKKILFTLGLLLASTLALATPPKFQTIMKLKASIYDPNTLLLTWQIKPGYFLYKDRIQLRLGAQSNLTMGPLNLPKALKKTDKLGHTFPVYRKQLLLPVAILGNTPGESILTVHYQGCADDGFCYPPQTQPFKLTINKALALETVQKEQSSSTVATEAIPSPKLSSFDQLFKHHWAIILLSFIGFGLLLSFTPCVLPMFPILSGIIAGHGTEITTRKAFMLSLSYVLSMSFTYALLGALVALAGKNLQISMQSPYAIGSLAILFVLLALSMFDFYEIRLPQAWQNKLGRVSRKKSSGNYLGAAIMGVLSILILSPCVTAPLIGALSYIAESGDVAFGSLALFFLSIGMGLPLLALGCCAGSLLPKAGPWMNRVKTFFGIIMLAMAIFLLQRILSPTMTMVLWGLLAMGIGMGLCAGFKLEPFFTKVKQTAGLLLFAYGAMLLVGSNQAHLTSRLFTGQINANSPSMKVANSPSEVNSILARSIGKPVLLDFYADWCTSCKVIAATTMQNKSIKKALEDFVVVKVDLSKNDEDTKALLAAFNVVAPPTFLFFNAEGQERMDLRMVGEISDTTLLYVLRSVAHPS